MIWYLCEFRFGYYGFYLIYAKRLLFILLCYKVHKDHHQEKNTTIIKYEKTIVF